MKIVHIISSLESGGAQRILYKLAKNSESRIAYYVISLKSEGFYGDRFREEGVEVYSLDLDRSYLLINKFLYLLKVMRGISPDVIQGWMYHGNLVASMASLFNKATVYWNIRHSLYSIKKEKPATRIIIRIGKYFSGLVQSIVYNSKVSAGQHEEFGYPQEKRILIPNGFECDQFKPDEAAYKRVREELDINDDTFVVGMVARYHPMKDHQNFLKAAQKVKHTYDKIRFILIGERINEENRELTQVIEKLGLSDSVILLGERSDIDELMPAFDMFTLTSAWGEAFPNVLGEAMSCGIPCVATDIGDSAYIINDTGIIVPPGDPEKLSEAWSRMIDMDDSKRRELGMKARERIRTNFEVSKIIKDYECLYQSSAD